MGREMNPKSTGASLSDMIESSKTPHLRVVYLPVGRKGIPTGRPAKVLFWAWRIRLGGFVGRIRPVFSPPHNVVFWRIRRRCPRTGVWQRGLRGSSRGRKVTSR